MVPLREMLLSQLWGFVSDSLEVDKLACDVIDCWFVIVSCLDSAAALTVASKAWRIVCDRCEMHLESLEWSEDEEDEDEDEDDEDEEDEEDEDRNPKMPGSFDF